ncbi:hypothetical protein [Lysobacter sp. CA199]|uniref:hypothetical protein n=1 Tax=Lysobacter sp. CA199 TaxID=3455608 RepID=UPI003F8D61EB
MRNALRIIVALMVVGIPIYAGVLYRSPWIVAPLTLSFTALYVSGKIKQWKLLASSQGTAGVIKALLLTLPIQAVLVGIFYLMGLGIGAIAGNHGLAERLDGFDLMLAGGLLVLGLAAGTAIHASETGVGDDESETAHALSSGIVSIMDDAFALGQQSVAMPAQIFSLARRLADHEDRGEALAAMEQFFDDDNAFVRRVAHTALRFMGQGGRDFDPQTLDRRIVEGMSDPAVWVRYDAAWAAGEIKGDDTAFATALKAMIQAAEAAGADDLDENDSAHTALKRARKSLDAVAGRS